MTICIPIFSENSGLDVKALVLDMKGCHYIDVKVLVQEFESTGLSVYLDSCMN